jgi:hypothetical protein
MTTLDARLLVGLRGPDLVASTARLALIHKMGFGERLAGLARYDFFHLSLEGDFSAEALIEALEKTLARQSTFYNRNKHRYSLECRWNGHERTDGPSHDELRRQFGSPRGGADAAGAGAASGSGIDFDGKGTGGPAKVIGSPAFLVEVSVSDHDSAGRDAIAAKLTRELTKLLGGTVRVSCPARDTVWWLGIRARGEAEAVETARQITVTKRRDEGLLMNPNYQRADFVSTGRIEPVRS